uniref:Uncharacterized protein n=1 Tax=Globodera rostochiensis TaxID=31243 RepID=A0A914HNM3_GLORO
MKILLQLSEVEEDAERKARTMMVDVQRKVEAKVAYALHLAEHRLSTKWTKMHEKQEQPIRRSAQHGIC